MAQLSSRTVASFGRSLSSGRVFAKFEFNQKDIDSLTEDLSYAALSGTIENAGQIREAGRKVLAFLKANYPKESAATRSNNALTGRRSSRIVDGWTVKFYTSKFTRSEASSLLGFAIEHRQAANDRIRTIIASLESGSRSYKITANDAQALRFRSNLRKRIQFASSAEIPARRGFGFLNKTEKYADDLTAAHGSMLERELVNIIEKGKSFKTQSGLSAAALAEPSAPVSAALDALSVTDASDALSRVRSPLKSIKSIKGRLASRRFSKSFR